MRILSQRAVTLVILSSVLQVLIFPVAGPLPAWRAALSWFALAPLLAALLPRDETISVWRGALLGYLSGFLWYGGTCYWIYFTMHIYGGLSAGMSLLVTVLFCLYLGLYHALFGAVVVLVRRLGPGVALAASPFLWIAVELARARITSFPWNLLGYAQIDNSALTLLAPITGVYGLSFVLMAVNSAIACLLVLPRRRTPATVALVAAVLATGVQNFGTWMRPDTHIGSKKAVMLQPNLAAGGGESLGVASLAVSSANLTMQASARDEAPLAVILWPESPSPFQTDRSDFTSVAAALARASGAPVIAGAIGIEPDSSLQRGARVYNSAVLFTPERGLSGRYDKIHLVPFGEFVPYANLFQFASGLTQTVGTFDRGRSRSPVTADGHSYGVFLCYESIFGDEVRRFVQGGAEVLTNLSDDGWYGDTSAPFQHINMARMRAIENRRWILRDTNNGITASIDPNGHVVETMPRNKRGAVAVHFEYLRDITFYTQHGDLFAYACALLALIAMGFALLARKRADVN
jgi:apolipoprotein N-acyltransferase